MKISEYNQMMAHLTRPKDSSSTANINNKPINKISSGVKALAKSKAMAKRIREPKVRNVDFKLGDPVAYVNEIKDVYQHDPDVYEINNNLNKYRSANDQRLLNYVDGVKNNDPKTLKAIDDYSDKLHYDSVRGQFKKGNKVGALSDFKNDEKLFEPILDRLKVKGKTAPVPFKRTQLDKVLDFNLAENIKQISKGMAEYQQLLKDKEGIEQEQQTPRPARAREGGLDMEFTKEKLDEKQILKDL